LNRRFGLTVASSPDTIASKVTTASHPGAPEGGTHEQAAADHGSSSRPNADASEVGDATTGRPEETGTIGGSGTEATMRISDAAERLGVSPRTLRFYEELRLVTPSGHTAGGARRYAPEDLARIERIQELKEILGLGLDEIRDVLDTESRIEELRRAYRENAGVSTDAARAERRAILVEALERRRTITEQLDRKMVRMASFRAKLVADAAKTLELLEKLEG
jgi:DNA-binding transcriptional MerR regulator